MDLDSETEHEILAEIRGHLVEAVAEARAEGWMKMQPWPRPPLVSESKTKLAGSFRRPMPVGVRPMPSLRLACRWSAP